MQMRLSKTILKEYVTFATSMQNRNCDTGKFKGTP